MSRKLPPTDLHPRPDPVEDFQRRFAQKRDSGGLVGLLKYMWYGGQNGLFNQQASHAPQTGSAMPHLMHLSTPGPSMYPSASSAVPVVPITSMTRPPAASPLARLPTAPSTKSRRLRPSSASSSDSSSSLSSTASESSKQRRRHRHKSRHHTTRSTKVGSRSAHRRHHSHRNHRHDGREHDGSESHRSHRRQSHTIHGSDATPRHNIRSPQTVTRSPDLSPSPRRPSPTRSHDHHRRTQTPKHHRAHSGEEVKPERPRLSKPVLSAPDMRDLRHISSKRPDIRASSSGSDNRTESDTDEPTFKRAVLLPQHKTVLQASHPVSTPKIPFVLPAPKLASRTSTVRGTPSSSTRVPATTASALSARDERRRNQITSASTSSSLSILAEEDEEPTSESLVTKWLDAQRHVKCNHDHNDIVMHIEGDKWMTACLHTRKRKEPDSGIRFSYFGFGSSELLAHELTVETTTFGSAVGVRDRPQNDILMSNSVLEDLMSIQDMTKINRGFAKRMHFSLKRVAGVKAYVRLDTILVTIPPTYVVTDLLLTGYLRRGTDAIVSYPMTMERDVEGAPQEWKWPIAAEAVDVRLFNTVPKADDEIEVVFRPHATNRHIYRIAREPKRDVHAATKASPDNTNWDSISARHGSKERRNSESRSLRSRDRATL